jgi:hypothetical protein
MKKFTITITIISIIAGIGVVCNALLNPLIGFVFGLLMISPLFVTLVMSKVLSGTGTQNLLFCSTGIYFPYFIYLFCFRSGPHGHFDLLALTYAVPFLIILWFVAGALSLKSAEQ